MQINFIKYRRFFFTLSILLVAGAIVSLAVFGLKFGIDFTGGSIMEVEYANQRDSNQVIREKIKDLNLGDVSVQPAGEKGVILRMKDINEETHVKILQDLGDVKELRFESIGPSVGRELKEKSILFAVLSLLAMIFYIAFSFRKVFGGVSSWQYGIVAVLALGHDVILPLGIFSLLGKFYGVEISAAIIVALLTVIGYSINNIVVVFDRIREKILRHVSQTFEETANKALNETLTRQLNTSLTTLFPLIAIYFLGGDTLKYFALALILGIVFGLYSSLFLSSQILVSWNLIKQEKKKTKQFSSFIFTILAFLVTLFITNFRSFSWKVISNLFHNSNE